MSRIGSWLRGSAKATTVSHTQSVNATEEAKYLEEALSAAAFIMEDDVEGAEKRLEQGNSSFHQVVRGLTMFMRALLGFEPEVMKAASERLGQAENSAWTDLKKAQKTGGGFQSSIYPPGTEFALCLAETELMNALIGVLNENLTDAIKGFYKLRKAYMTLSGIMEVEQKYMRQRQGITTSSETSISSSSGEKQMPGGFGDDAFMEVRSSHIANGVPSIKFDKVTNQHLPTKEPSTLLEDDDSDLDFVDADESHSGDRTPANYLGHVTSNEDIEKRLNGLSVDDREGLDRSESMTSAVSSDNGKRGEITLNMDSEAFAHPIDVFVHSGASLCYGLLLLVMSLIPPAFNKLLAIVGFRGDRERGVNLLWQSTKFPNINGAVAGLVLLGYYNINIGFADILLPETNSSGDNVAGYPRARCQALLTDMRTRYPRSRMWRLEEARMQSGKRDLEGAIKILRSNEDSPMKQIAALNKFELSLTAMFGHNYLLCAESFLGCADISNWSHVIYYYIAGAAHLELYRDLRHSAPKQAKVHKEKAAELLRKSPTLAGKKRFMAKQLPLDVFVVRKVQKWEARVRDWGVDFVDAIGVSPLEEMIYLWNGTKRMGVLELETSAKNLDWQRTSHHEMHESNLDELAEQALLRSAVLRNLGRLEDARNILKEQILSHDPYVSFLLSL